MWFKGITDLFCVWQVGLVQKWISNNKVKFSSIYSLKGSSVTWKDVLLMYVVLALSGNPYIQGKYFQVFLVIVSIVPIVYVLRNNHKPVSINTILIFLFLIGYEFMHSLMYDLDYSLTIFKITIYKNASICFCRMESKSF